MEHPLRAYRTRHNLTLEAFAERCGVAKATISRIETGTADASMDLARTITRVTGGEITANDLASAKAQAPAPRAPSAQPKTAA